MNQSSSTLQEENTWVSVWGNAVSITENRPESYARNITLRYPVYCPFSGNAARLTFDNYCGTEAITLTKVTVFADGTFYPVLFDHKSSVTIAAGSFRVSDEIVIPVTNASTLTVSIYLGDFTQMRSGVFVSGPLSNDASYAIGDLAETPGVHLDKDTTSIPR